MFAPLAELFHNHLKALIISFGACVLNAVGFYTVLTYLPTYLSDTVGMDAPQSGTITTICLVAYVFMVFGMGHISDKFGRKKVLIGACVAFIVLTVPGGCGCFFGRSGGQSKTSAVLHGAHPVQ